MKQFILFCCTIILTFNGYAADQNSKPLMKDFMGINGHFHFRPELYKQVCRLVRNYHNIDWDVKQPGDPITFPVCANQVNWKEQVYGKWVPHGFEVDICAQFGSFSHQNENFPSLWDGQTEWAYQYGFEMAKYFGPSGSAKLCTSIEIGNEPGQKFDDALYQELFKAMAKGIREGDPNVKIVTCTAQAFEKDDYSKDVRETFADEEIKALFDVINVHTYALQTEEKRSHPWERSYPEDPDINYLKVIDETIQWRDNHAPGKEIWVTEFGWDACTPQAMEKREGWFKKLNWTGETDLQQAQYLVRSFLCMAALDIDRAYIYFYDDDDQASVHAASGVTRGFEPKMSFWAVKQLYELLGGYRFNRIVKQDAGLVYAYEFISPSKPNAPIWMVWSPTASNREVKIDLDTGELIPTKMIEMATTGSVYSEVPLQKSSGHDIEIEVSESPVYLYLNQPK